MATALDILKTAREYAADPEHVSIHPYNVYETPAGSVTHLESAVRGCLLGIEGIACRILTIESNSKVSVEAMNALEDAVEGCPHPDVYSWVMQRGHSEVLKTYDRAIAALEAPNAP